MLEIDLGIRSYLSRSPMRSFMPIINLFSLRFASLPVAVPLKLTAISMLPSPLSIHPIGTPCSVLLSTAGTWIGRFHKAHKKYSIVAKY
jgi:hypothetical protein